MKKLSIIALVLLSISTYAQKTKTVDIWSRPVYGQFLKAIYAYDDNNQVSGVHLFIAAKDQRYMHLNQLFSVYNAEPKELYEFIKSVAKFASENEAGTATTIEGHHVALQKVAGFNEIDIYSDQDNAYHGFDSKGLQKIISKIEEWASENKVAL